MSGHTKGPWHTAATDDSLVLAGRQKIASVYGVEDDMWGMENARLIAAAPDLLEALILMRRAYVGPHIEDDSEWFRVVEEAEAKSAAAIARATEAQS